MTDLLLHDDGYVLLPHWLAVNHLDSLTAYRDVVAKAGFSEVDVRDITEPGLRRYLAHMVKKVDADWAAGICDATEREVARQLLQALDYAHRFNVMCVATK